MTGYRDQNLALFIGIVIFVLFVPRATGSTRRIMKVVSAGKHVSLDCIVPKYPNVGIVWRRAGRQNAIAYVDKLKQTAHFHADFNNQLHITVNYTKSWTTTLSVFTITIWNITATDSSIYKCDTIDYVNGGSVVVYYSYHIYVVDCACFAVGNPVTCFLNKYRTTDCIPVHIEINGNYVARSRISPPNEIVASQWTSEEDRRNDIEIQVSSVQSSTTNIDVLCILPALEQSSVLPTSSQPSSLVSSLPKTASGKSTTTATSLPTYQVLSTKTNIIPPIFVNKTPRLDKWTAAPTAAPLKNNQPLSTTSRFLNDLNKQSQKITVSTANAKIFSISSSPSPAALTLDPMNMLSATKKTKFPLNVSPSPETTSTKSPILNVSGKQETLFFIFIVIISIVSFLVIVLCITVTIMCRKKKRNPRKLPSTGVSSADYEQTDNGVTVEMDQYPVIIPSLGNNKGNISSNSGSVGMLQTCIRDQTTAVCSNKIKDEDGYVITSTSAICEKHTRYRPEDYEYVIQNYASKNHGPIQVVKEDSESVAPVFNEPRAKTPTTKLNEEDDDGYVVPDMEINSDRDEEGYLVPFCREHGERDMPSMTDIDGYVVPTFFTGQEKKESNKDRDGYMYLLPTMSINTGENTRYEVAGHGYCLDNFYESVN